MLATCQARRGRKWRSQAGSSLPTASKAGVRGARSPGKEPASRGAGVNGECGANVAISRMNGRPAETAWRMKRTPFDASTSVR